MKVRIQSIERLKNNPLGEIKHNRDFQLNRCLWQCLNEMLYERICNIQPTNECGVEYLLNEIGIPKYFIFKETIEEILE